MCVFLNTACHIFDTWFNQSWTLLTLLYLNKYKVSSTPESILQTVLPQRVCYYKTTGHEWNKYQNLYGYKMTQYGKWSIAGIGIGVNVNESKRVNNKTTCSNVSMLQSGIVKAGFPHTPILYRPRVSNAVLHYYDLCIGFDATSCSSKGAEAIKPCNTQTLNGLPLTIAPAWQRAFCYHSLYQVNTINTLQCFKWELFSSMETRAKNCTMLDGPYKKRIWWKGVTKIAL